MTQFKRLLLLTSVLFGCVQATAGSADATKNADIRLIGYQSFSDCSAYYSCSSIDGVPLVQIVGANVRNVKFCDTHKDVLSFAYIDYGVPLLDQLTGYRDDGRGRGNVIPWYGLDELQAAGHLETNTGYDLKIGSCIELFDKDGNSLLKKTIVAVELKL